MWPSVREAFPKFTDTFEGKCSWMYLDVLGLVTTGRGNLIDPWYQEIPHIGWHHVGWQKEGQIATDDEVYAAWVAVKMRQDLRTHGGGEFFPITSLRLTLQAIDSLTFAKLDEVEVTLQKRFPNWQILPADAQLGCLSLAWACGANFKFPKFEQALRDQDYLACALESQMDASGNPGLVPRNAAQARLFLNAQTCINADLPRDLLQY